MRCGPCARALVSTRRGRVYTQLDSTHVEYAFAHRAMRAVVGHLGSLFLPLSAQLMVVCYFTQRSSDVVAVVQLSVDRLGSLLRLARGWNGA